MKSLLTYINCEMPIALDANGNGIHINSYLRFQDDESHKWYGVYRITEVKPNAYEKEVIWGYKFKEETEVGITGVKEAQFRFIVCDREGKPIQ